MESNNRTADLALGKAGIRVGIQCPRSGTWVKQRTTTKAARQTS